MVLCCSLLILELLGSALSSKSWAFIYWRLLCVSLLEVALCVLMGLRELEGWWYYFGSRKRDYFLRKQLLSSFFFCFLTDIPSPVTIYQGRNVAFMNICFLSWKKQTLPMSVSFKASITYFGVLNVSILFKQEGCLNCETELQNFRWLYSFSS